MKYIKKYPYFIVIILSTIILGITGYIGRDSLYSDFNVALLKTPQLAVVFEGLGNGKYPWMILSNKSEYNKIGMDQGFDQAANLDSEIDGTAIYTDNEYKDTDHSLGGNAIVNTNTYEDEIQKNDSNNSVIDQNLGNNIVKNEIDKELDNNSTTSSDSAEIIPPKEDNNKDNEGEIIGTVEEDRGSEKIDKNDSDIEIDKNTDINTDMNTEIITDIKTDKNTDNNSNPQSKDGNNTVVDSSDKVEDNNTENNSDIESEKYDFQTVTQDYFDDALFIGDSRTVGLSEYSGLKNPTYYADVGLNIYEIFERRIAKIGEEQVTILEALQQKQFKKIYIMVGINELGRGTTETFIKEYQKVLNTIQTLQPNTIIFVEGILKVGKEKSDKDPIFNNINITEKNDNIALLANNKDIFYIDVNEAITDQSGNLPSNYTFDNIHLKAAYYSIWTDFLLGHGIIIN